MGWGGPWSSLLRRLSIPQDAGPNDPRIVLGDDIPEELTAPSPNGYGSAIRAAIIYHLDADTYAYSAIVNGDRVEGVVNRNNTDPIAEMYRFRYGTGGPGTRGELLFTSAIGAISDYYFDTGRVFFSDVVEFGWTTNLAGFTQLTGELRIDGRSAPRGMVARVATTATSAAIGGVRTAVLSIPATTYKANRAYELRMYGGIAATVSGMWGDFRTSRNDTGATIGEYYRAYVPVTANVWPATATHCRFRVGAADRTVAIDLTVAAGGGAGTVQHFAFAGQPRGFEVWDIGAAADYPETFLMT